MRRLGSGVRGGAGRGGESVTMLRAGAGWCSGGGSVLVTHFTDGGLRL